MPQVKGAPTPHGEDPYISPLQEKVLGLLEDAGVHESFCDRIMKIIEEHENDEACAADERRASGE
jgi:hypothetical protein